MSAEVPIAASSVLERSTQVAWREVDDEGVLLDAQNDIVVGLNASACVLWEALDGKKPVEVLVRETVMEEFDVPFDVALGDALTIMQQLVEDGLAIRRS